MKEEATDEEDSSSSENYLKLMEGANNWLSKIF
jgi:hypothetical protein